jgi:hypothetical protein
MIDSVGLEKKEIIPPSVSSHSATPKKREMKEL